MEIRGLLRRFGDPLLAGVLALVMSLELVAWARDDMAPATGAALLACLPLALRRRSPVASFLLVMTGIELLGWVQPGFDNDSFGLVAVLFIALYSLGRHTTGLEAWVGGAGLVAAMLLFVHDDGGLGQADLGDAGFALMFLGGPWAAGLAMRLRHEREITLGAENQRLHAEQEARAARAVAEERSRIARELHDVVSHAISVTVLQARGARRTLDSDPVAVREALDAIERTNTSALGDMRRLLAVLRDTEDEVDEHAPQPTLARLDDLLGHVRQSGVPVEVETFGSARDLPPGVDLSAYRIVQEALTNVIKHSADATARVTLEYGDTDLAVSVVNDGTPRKNGTGLGHGLIGIRERVAVVGGEVEAGPAPDGGFRISARLPYSLEVS